MPENEENIEKVVEEIEGIYDLDKSKIELLHEKINRLESRIASYENAKYIFQRDQLTLSNAKKEFESRARHALYYEALVSVINNNPSLQGEWVKFMTYIKLVVDPEEMKDLL